MFFDDCKDQEEMIAKRRKLQAQYHPDKGGDPAMSQKINEEFNEHLSTLPKANIRESYKSILGDEYEHIEVELKNTNIPCIESPHAAVWGHAANLGYVGDRGEACGVSKAVYSKIFSHTKENLLKKYLTYDMLAGASDTESFIIMRYNRYHMHRFGRVIFITDERLPEDCLPKDLMCGKVRDSYNELFTTDLSKMRLVFNGWADQRFASRQYVFARIESADIEIVLRESDDLCMKDLTDAACGVPDETSFLFSVFSEQR